MKYFVYILYSVSIDHFYIGQTWNIHKRLIEHNSGTNRFTKRSKDWRLLYYEVFQTRAEAMNRESYFKSLKNKEYLKKFIKLKRSVN